MELDTIDSRVAQAIDANGDQPWVWTGGKCHALSYEQCEWHTEDNFKDCGECPCLEIIPLPFSRSPEAAWRLLEYWKGLCLQDNETGHRMTVAYSRFMQREMFTFTKDSLCLVFLQSIGAK